MSLTAKPKRNGNDELPTDRVAVKIIRNSRTVDSPRSQRGNSPTKQPVTKVSKLVYETKRQATTAVVKSVHSYRRPVETSASPERKRSKRTTEKVLVTESSHFSNVRNESKTKVDLNRKSSEHMPISFIATQYDLIEKKEEIRKDVNEINEILQGLTDKNIPPSIDKENQNTIEVGKLPDSNIQFSQIIPQVNANKYSQSSSRRSKTDPNISVRGRLRSIPNSGDSKRQSTRSKSSTARSQPPESIAASNVTAKQKSYDPDKARQYMQEQKEKRKAQAATEKSALSRIEREEIKKRLENLRKNTLAILHKNITRARKKSENGVASLVNIDLGTTTNLGDSSQITKPLIGDPPKKENSIQSTLNDTDTFEIAKPQKKLTNQVKPLQTLEENKTVNSVKTKKVGLLRRTDVSGDGTFENLDPLEVGTNKENIFLIPFRKTQNSKTESPASPPLPSKCAVHTPQLAGEEEKPLPDLELNVPDVKLKPKTRRSVAEKSTQAEQLQPDKPMLPYWLQPTPVQLYPYNFIKAVRKKLEAITNPVLTNKGQQTETMKIPAIETVKKSLPRATLPLSVGARRRLLSRPNLHEVSSVNVEHGPGHKLSSASSVFSPFLNSPAISPNGTSARPISAQPPPTPPPPVHEQSKSLSEITSSVTVNVPISNTVSEASSLNSDFVKKQRLSSTHISQKNSNRTRKHEDDTTASSSVFSSPEKRLPQRCRQPEMRNIPSASKTSLSSEMQKQIGEQIVSPLSVEKVKNLTLKSKSSSSSLAEMKSREDFEQMLQDFNKSLSHVIEVNQQLQTALSKSPRSTSKSMAESIKTNYSGNEMKSASHNGSGKSDKYSSDFEKSVSETAMNNELNSEADTVGSKIIDKTNTYSGDNSISASNRTYNINGGDSPSKALQSVVSSPVPKLSLDSSSLSKQVSEETIKNGSNNTEHFPDSIEEVSYMKIIMSPNRQQPLQESNNFSKDSLEVQNDDTMEVVDEKKSVKSKEDIVRNQINVIRGDGSDQSCRQMDILVSHTIQSNPSTIRLSDDSISHRPILNSSMGSDIFAIFNQSEMELSIYSQSSRVSDAPLNYSTLGLYEQLIKTEATKTEHLTALLKIREKSILDRTRGQIALLEIQKEKCKAKGLTVQISIIKRKQRAILMKMEKEREEIRRVLKLSERDLNQRKNSQSLYIPKIPELPASMDLSLRRSSTIRNEVEASRRIMRGYEVDTGQNLEILLRGREKELEKRREHVERLLKWHQRLDKEEEEVLKIEEMLYKYNQQKQNQQEMTTRNSMERKKETKLKEINKSLRELQSISTNSGNETVASIDTNHDYVRTSGRKLNKLWCRLTGRKEIRFEQTKRYKLTKPDLEKIYEDAKVAVLADFNENDRMAILTDQSKCQQSTESLPMGDSVETVKKARIPRLNLNFSSGASEVEQQGTAESVGNASFTRAENMTEKDSASDDFVENFTDDNIESNGKTISPVRSSAASRSSSESEDSKPKSIIVDFEANNVLLEKSAHVEDKIVPRADNFIIDPSLSNRLSSEKDTSSENVHVDSPSKSDAGISVTSLAFVSGFKQLDLISPKPNSDSSKLINSLHHDNCDHKVFLEKSEAASGFSSSSCHDDLVERINESLSMIEDITAPKFESTGEDTIADEQISELIAMEIQPNTNNSTNANIETHAPSNTSVENQEDRPPSVLEKRLIDLENSLIEINNSFERALSPENSSKPAPIAIETDLNNIETNDDKCTQVQDLSLTKVTVKDFLLNPEVTTSLMPDIINEVELRRRQQILVESDIKHLENAVPYALLREIPNKPPPPYVPPAHGSPMTTIFPSEARIKDITFRRTKELYEELNGTDNPSEKTSSILDENITNIYERIILDICKECINDYQPTFTDNLVVVGSYKMPLALYNPPNRLKCVQEFVYKRVRKLLNMDKRPKRPNSIFSLGRRKRDHVDEILIKELFEEEHKWTNFDLEEEEVRDSVVDEVFEEIIKELIDNFEESFAERRKTSGYNDHMEISHNENFVDMNGDKSMIS